LVPAEIIARIIVKTVALVEATLGNLVSVTNVSGNVTPSLLPSGETYVGYLSDLVEVAARLMAAIMSYLS
jgi:hypothetical protein